MRWTAVAVLLAFPAGAAELKPKTLQLLLEGESREGSSAMQIANVRRTPAGVFQMDPHFVAPTLDLTQFDLRSLEGSSVSSSKAGDCCGCLTAAMSGNTTLKACARSSAGTWSQPEPASTAC